MHDRRALRLSAWTAEMLVKSWILGNDWQRQSKSYAFMCNAAHLQNSKNAGDLAVVYV